LSTSADPAVLVERMGSVRSADVRRMLREGLIRRGALPRPQLEAALKSDDPNPRAEAAWIAGYAGETARPLGDTIAIAVGASEAGFRGTESGARGGAAKLANEAHAWRASLWAARRVGAAGAVAVESAATNAATDLGRVPLAVRREATEVLAVAASGSALETLSTLAGDGDREVRAVASTALAAHRPAAAAGIVRGVGARADATTIAPLALAAWKGLAAPMIGGPGTRAWALAVALQGSTIPELVAIASGSGEDPARLAAIAALGRAGGDEALAVLEKIHGNDAESDAVKLAAWKALKRLLRRVPKVYAEGEDKGKGGPSGGGGGAVDEDDGDDDFDD